MSALGEHLHILGVVLVDLTAFENLQAHGSVLVVGEERTTARFAHVLHNTADAHRSVELLAQIDDEVGILEVLDILLAAAKVVLNEADNLLKFLVIICSSIEKTEILEGLLLQGDEHTGNHLLIGDGFALESVGHHVVDVLDEDHVGVNLVEILDERAMASRTEEQRTVGIAERSVVGIGSNSVGTRLLLRERDVILHAVFLGIEISLVGHLLLEERHVLMTHCEVNICLAI